MELIGFKYLSAKSKLSSKFILDDTSIGIKYNGKNVLDNTLSHYIFPYTSSVSPDIKSDDMTFIESTREILFRGKFYKCIDPDNPLLGLERKVILDVPKKSSAVLGANYLKIDFLGNFPRNLEDSTYYEMPYKEFNTYVEIVSDADLYIHTQLKFKINVIGKHNNITGVTYNQSREELILVPELIDYSYDYISNTNIPLIAYSYNEDYSIYTLWIHNSLIAINDEDDYKCTIISPFAVNTDDLYQIYWYPDIMVDNYKKVESSIEIPEKQINIIATFENDKIVSYTLADYNSKAINDDITLIQYLKLYPDKIKLHVYDEEHHYDYILRYNNKSQLHQGGTWADNTNFLHFITFDSTLNSFIYIQVRVVKSSNSIRFEKLYYIPLITSTEHDNDLSVIPVSPYVLFNLNEFNTNMQNYNIIFNSIDANDSDIIKYSNIGNNTKIKNWFNTNYSADCMYNINMKFLLDGELYYDLTVIDVNNTNNYFYTYTCYDVIGKKSVNVEFLLQSAGGVILQITILK